MIVIYKRTVNGHESKEMVTEVDPPQARCEASYHSTSCLKNGTMWVRNGYSATGRILDANCLAIEFRYSKPWAIVPGSQP